MTDHVAKYEELKKKYSFGNIDKKIILGAVIGIIIGLMWKIILIGGAIAVVGYFLLRRKNAGKPAERK